MALALFDLDHTLLDGDSDFEWGELLVRKNLVDQKKYSELNRYFYEQYEQSKLDIVEYSKFFFKSLSERSLEELAELHNEFMQSSIIPMMKSQSHAILEKHRGQGDILILISATNTFIGKPIADYLGIHHLLATQPKIVKGRYTNEIEGSPCFREGKVTCLKEWMNINNENLEGSYFYSDSINDLPLLEIVDTPIAVDPDKELEKIAKDRGWSITSLK